MYYPKIIFLDGIPLLYYYYYYYYYYYLGNFLGPWIRHSTAFIWERTVWKVTVLIRFLLKGI